MRERPKKHAKPVARHAWFTISHRLWDIFALAGSLVYLILFRLPYRVLARPRTLVILDYHDVEAVEARSFRRQMEFLKRRWRFLPLEQVIMCIRGGQIPSRAAHVTFDDAPQSVADNALPILRELGVPASLYVATGLVEGPPELLHRIRRPMNWDSIRATDCPSFRFESHTDTHLFLDELRPDQKARELSRSRQMLADMLAREITCVCYPGGRFDEETKRVAKECGYQVGLSTLTHTDQPSDPFEVRRLPVTPRMGLLRIWLLCQGAYNWYAPLSRWRQRRLMRLARRKASRPPVH